MYIQTNMRALLFEAGVLFVRGAHKGYRLHEATVDGGPPAPVYIPYTPRTTLPQGSKDPNNRISGPKYFNANVIWALRPDCLGPGTLRFPYAPKP